MQWEPSWEPESNLEGCNELIDDWQRQQDGVPDSFVEAPDAHLTDLQRQGIHGENRYMSHMRSAARHKLHFEHRPVAVSYTHLTLPTKRIV